MPAFQRHIDSGRHGRWPAGTPAGPSSVAAASSRGDPAAPSIGPPLACTLLGAAVLAACVAGGPALGAETRQVPDLTPNPGHLLMFEHVPDGLSPGAPLVVALHGCT